MILCRILCALILLAALPAVSPCAPPPPRPEAGVGVLLARPSLAASAGTSPVLVLYREPGVGRLGEWKAASLPLLPFVKTPADLYPLAVVAKRGGWLKVAYDDAGRAGWAEMERSWSFLSWEEFLKGRSVRLLPGLRKPFYVMRSGPDDQSAEVRTLTPESFVRVVEVRGDRARVLFDVTLLGWLRWRDEDGRLLIGFE